jgi:ketosteroid isomerase-like protein
MLSLLLSGVRLSAALVPSSFTPRSVTARLLLQTPGQGDAAAAIRGLLQKFADAYSAKDAAAIKLMFRGANEAQLKRRFADTKRLRVEVQDCKQIEFNGNVASLSCTWSLDYEGKVGGPQPRRSSPMPFVLEKGPDGWTIISQGTGS